MPVCFVANEFSVALQAYVGTLLLYVRWGFSERQGIPGNTGSRSFYLGYLTEYDGYLVTCPSTSPENCFLDRKGEKHSVTFASTMDISILKELFATYLQICKILKVDVLEKETEFALKKLPPFKIGHDGQLQEWYRDYRETDIHHRHVSHLYGYILEML